MTTDLLYIATGLAGWALGFVGAAILAFSLGLAVKGISKLIKLIRSKT